jgi:hypothetical protein
MWREKAAAVALRVEPNSSTSGRRKIEKDCRGPMEIPQVARIVPATIQP